MKPLPPFRLNAITITIALACAALASPGQAREDAGPHDVRRLMGLSSLERDQQSDAFALQLRQHQLELNAAPGDRPRLEALHAEQRRDFERLVEEQRRAAGTPGAPAWGPRLDSGPQMERERRLLIGRVPRAP